MRLGVCPALPSEPWALWLLPPGEPQTALGGGSRRRQPPRAGRATLGRAPAALSLFPWAARWIEPLPSTAEGWVTPGSCPPCSGPQLPGLENGGRDLRRGCARTPGSRRPMAATVEGQGQLRLDRGEGQCPGLMPIDRARVTGSSHSGQVNTAQCLGSARDSPPGSLRTRGSVAAQAGAPRQRPSVPHSCRRLRWSPSAPRVRQPRPTSARRCLPRQGEAGGGAAQLGL